MPRVTIGICEKCGDSFTINLDECVLLPGMRPKTRKQDEVEKPIRTWTDWIEHIGNNCPNCRFPSPPLQALDDLAKFKEKRRA